MSWVPYHRAYGARRPEVRRQRATQTSTGHGGVEFHPAVPTSQHGRPPLRRQIARLVLRRNFRLLVLHELPMRLAVADYSSRIISTQLTATPAQAGGDGALGRTISHGVSFFHCSHPIRKSPVALTGSSLPPTAQRTGAYVTVGSRRPEQNRHTLDDDDDDDGTHSEVCSHSGDRHHGDW